MYTKKLSLIQSFLLISLLVCFGCGEGGDGTLEFKFNTPQDSQITEARVRVDTKDRWTLDLSEKLHSRQIEAGRYIVGVDLFNGSGEKVGTYWKIVEVNEGETRRIDITMKPPSEPISDNDCIRFSASDVNFQITQPGQYILLPDGKSLKATGGAGILDLGLIEVFDCVTGKRTGEIIVSSEYIGDPSIWEFDEKEGKFKGSGSGRFIIYRGRKEEGEVIFDGNFIADPPGNLRAVVNPAEGTLIEFKVLYRLEAKGKGIYSDHILEGTAVSELKGDNFVVSMDAEIKRKPQ